MGKLFSLNGQKLDSQELDNKEHLRISSLNIVSNRSEWDIVISPNGYYFSGLPILMVDMIKTTLEFEDFENNKFDEENAQKALEDLIIEYENTYNTVIRCKIACLIKNVEKYKIPVFKSDQKIIQMDENQRGIFDFIEVEAHDFAAIWHEGNNYSYIYINI